MRLFIDTEFIDDGVTVDLISIGIVAEDGREFYAEVEDVDLSKASDWVKENVIPHLWHRQPNKAKYNAWVRDEGFGGLFCHSELAREIKSFVGDDPKPEFWAYFADYDWVAFCQIFGTMMDLPKGFPMFCNDIKQWAVMLGDPQLPEQGKGEHHALEDARWVRDAYLFLQSYKQGQEVSASAVVDGVRVGPKVGGKAK